MGLEVSKTCDIRAAFGLDITGKGYFKAERPIQDRSRASNETSLGLYSERVRWMPASQVAGAAREGPRFVVRADLQSLQFL
jgi:hypothetical protein